MNLREKTGLKSIKKIFDEVHGYIELTEVELRLVDTAIFQRLRYVKQLAVAWYVYPGATHTRFSHSVGAMHIMGLIASRLYSLGYIHHRDDIQVLRIAALLHDLGHTPFSHAIEPFYRDRLKLEHEELTKLMILESPEITEVLSSYGFDPKEIVAILEGKHREPLYNQLVSSDLDVDRMDYLLRDALHTGVSYGSIDIHRLINTLVVDGEGNLAILDKGIEALENFYVARLHMYRAVYYHKTLVGYELLLRKIYEKLAEIRYDDMIFDSKSDLIEAIRSGYISLWNDSWLIGTIIKAYRDPKVDPKIKELIRYFLERRGYKVLLDKSCFEYSSLDLELDPDIRYLRDTITYLYRYLNSDEVSVFVDDIKIIDEDPLIAPHVIVEGKSSVSVMELRNSIIPSLPRRYHIKRLYVLGHRYEEAKKVLKS